MADDFVIVPSREADYVELARNRKTQGRIFRKHILNKGTLLHPVTGNKIVIDDEFFSTLKRNFDNGVCDIVQVPLADSNNEHSEDPTRNIGEVIDLQEDGEKIYAVIDARDPAMADKLGKTLLGASAMMNLNYKDTSTGERVGPTLLHACVTNRPYVTGLEDYQEIVSASADSSNDAVMLTDSEEEPALEVADEVVEEATVEVPVDVQSSVQEIRVPLVVEIRAATEQPHEEPVITTEPELIEESDPAIEPEIPEEAEMPKTLDELLAELKEEHGIDVSALKQEAAKVDGLEEELAGLRQVAEKVPSLEEQAALIPELQKQIEEIPSLQEQIDSIPELKEAAEVGAALSRSLAEALEESGIVQLTAGDSASSEDIVSAVSELASGYVELSQKIQVLERKEAELEVQALIDEGRILPSKKEIMTNLKLTAPDTFDALLPEQPIVHMNVERGVTPPEEKAPERNIDEEIARLTSTDGPLAGHPAIKGKK